MKNKYQAGANFERRVVKELEAQGWDCFRSAGSHGYADVIALKAGEIRLIQCQLDNYFPPAKREVLIDGARRNGVQGFLAWREGRKLIMEQVY